MILRDEHGEIQVRIGDLIKYEGAILAVLCPEADCSDHLICVRLKSGVITDNDGIRFEYSENNNNIRFIWPAEFVASCVRAYRLDHPAETPYSFSQRPTESVAKSSGARARQKDAGKAQPKTDSLFD